MKKVSINTLKLTGRFSLGVAACLSLFLACTGLETPGTFAFGLPVGIPALVLYVAALLWSGPYLRRECSRAGRAGAAVLAAVVAAALWFSCLEMRATSFLSPWCSVIHGCAAVGAACLWAARMKSVVPRTARRAGRWDKLSQAATGCFAAVCVGLLAAGSLLHATQSAAMEESAAVDYFGAEEPIVETGLALLGGKHRVNPEDFPVIGSDAADAPVAVMLCDYTSDLCRQYLAALQSGLPAAEKPVRIIVLPVTREPENEDVQRIVLTLFHTDRNAWRSLSALITSGQIPAKPGAVERAASRLAGAKKWEGALEGNAYRITHQIQLAASLLEESRRDGKTAAGPVLIYASRALMPATPDMNEFMTFLKSDTAPAGPVKTPAGQEGEATATAAVVRDNARASLSAAY